MNAQRNRSGGTRVLCCACAGLAAVAILLAAIVGGAVVLAGGGRGSGETTAAPTTDSTSSGSTTSTTSAAPTDPYAALPPLPPEVEGYRWDGAPITEDAPAAYAMSEGGRDHAVAVGFLPGQDAADVAAATLKDPQVVGDVTCGLYKDFHVCVADAHDGVLFINDVGDLGPVALGEWSNAFLAAWG